MSSQTLFDPRGAFIEYFFGDAIRYLSAKGIFGGWIFMPLLFLIVRKALLKSFKHKPLSPIEKFSVVGWWLFVIVCIFDQAMMW